MPRLKFDDRAIKALKPPESGRLEYWDATPGYSGFGLRVSCLVEQPGGEPPKGGSKTFMVRYRQGGRQRRYKLGTYPKLPLADARQKALGVLRAVEAGEDPADERQTSLSAPTFDQLATEYLTRYAKVRKRSWKVDESVIDRTLTPKFGKRKAAEITRGEIVSMLDKIRDGNPDREIRAANPDKDFKPAPVMANRTLEIIRRVYSWGVKADLVPHNPCAGIEKPAKENRSDRWLNDTEVKAVWDASDTLDAKMRAYFRLLMLTAQRPGEVRTMHRDDIDLDAGWWIIPGAEPEGFEGTGRRTKNGLTHAVPLSETAQEELKVAMKLSEKDEDGWVFPKRGGGGPMGTTAVNKALAELHKASDDVEHFTPHALRATAATHLGMEPLSFDEVTITKVLNHKSQSITSKYVRHSYDREKRRALDAWARRVKDILAKRKADKVVALHG